MSTQSWMPFHAKMHSPGRDSSASSASARRGHLPTNPRESANTAAANDRLARDVVGFRIAEQRDRPGSFLRRAGATERDLRFQGLRQISADANPDLATFDIDRRATAGGCLGEARLDEPEGDGI